MKGLRYVYNGYNRMVYTNENYVKYTFLLYLYGN